MAPGRFVDAVGTRTPAAQPWMPVLGYGAQLARPPGTVTVLTPQSVVEALRAGYRPAVHPTAG